MYIRRIGRRVHEALVRTYEKELKRRLDGFERLLRKQKYIAGDVWLSLWSGRRDRYSTYLGLEQDLSLVDLILLSPLW